MVTATDPDFESVSEWFTVDVPIPDTQPSFGAQVVANQTYTAGEPITPLVLPQATGGNGALTYALAPTVPGLTFDPAARTLTGTPTAMGDYGMTYTATDAGGASASLTFAVAVGAALPSAVIIGAPTGTSRESEFSFEVSGAGVTHYRAAVDAGAVCPNLDDYLPERPVGGLHLWGIGAVPDGPIVLCVLGVTVTGKSR